MHKCTELKDISVTRRVNMFTTFLLNMYPYTNMEDEATSDL